MLALLACIRFFLTKFHSPLEIPLNNLSGSFAGESAAAGALLHKPITKQQARLCVVRVHPNKNLLKIDPVREPILSGPVLL
jgi:hypothetical protein